MGDFHSGQHLQLLFDADEICALSLPCFQLDSFDSVQPSVARGIPHIKAGVSELWRGSHQLGLRKEAHWVKLMLAGEALPMHP